MAVVHGDVAVNPQPVAEEPEASTRQQVLASLLTNGASTVAELAERLGLTTAAIRRHLGTLTDSGQVSSEPERVYGQRGRGRPARVYVLTRSGRSQFYQAYDELAVQALAALFDTAGPQAVERLGQQRVQAVADKYHALREADPDGDPVEALARALTSDGYVARVDDLPTGEQLCQHHCPVAEVAGQYPQLCEQETKVFSELLGMHVQRLATIAHGDGVCTTNIPRRPWESAPRGDRTPEQTPGYGRSFPTVPHSGPATNSSQEAENS